jgi:hypothetical protein
MTKIVSKIEPSQKKGLRGVEWVNVGSEGRRKLCIA